MYTCFLLNETTSSRAYSANPTLEQVTGVSPGPGKADFVYNIRAAGNWQGANPQGCGKRDTPRAKCCPHSQDKSRGYYSLKEMSVKLLSSSVGSRPHPAPVWLQIRNRQTEIRARRWLPGLWPPPPGLLLPPPPPQQVPFVHKVKLLLYSIQLFFLSQ